MPTKLPSRSQLQILLQEAEKVQEQWAQQAELCPCRCRHAQSACSTSP